MRFGSPINKTFIANKKNMSNANKRTNAVSPFIMSFEFWVNLPKAASVLESTFSAKNNLR